MLKPLQNRVLIEPTEVEKTTKSGIIIPDSAQEKPQTGIVLAIGPGLPSIPMTVKVGDSVLYGKYSGTELKLEDGKSYILMPETEIYAIN